MNKLKKIKNHLLFGGVSKNLYVEIIPLITEDNNNMGSGLAIITSFFGWLTSVLSYFGILSKRAFPAYLFLFVTSAIFMIVRRLFKLNKTATSHTICLLQSMCLVIFGMLNSTMYAPDPKANGTIFVVLLLVFPFIIIGPPIEIDVIAIVLTFFYCFTTYIFKDPIVHKLDFTNAIFVCAIAILCNWIFATKNIQSIVNRFYIEKERDTDMLTGLLTKQAGKTLTTSHINRGVEGSLFILDMDNFKKLNDTFGHLYGDEILVKLADVIKQNTRRIDVSARFGGDEFVIFFPNMTSEEAEVKANNIFNSLKKAFKREKTKISCSLGVATTKQFQDYEEAFKMADNALYDAKNSGKNKFVIY